MSQQYNAQYISVHSAQLSLTEEQSELTYRSNTLGESQWKSLPSTLSHSIMGWKHKH